MAHPGAAQPAPRGRPPRHRRDDVVAAAVGLADADGLAAVTMRSVAARLGTGVMSLYRYVSDKQELVAAMVDRVTRDQEYPPPSGDWRADVHRLARVQRDVLVRHPWLVDAVSHTQPLGEGTVRALEFALAALEPVQPDPAVRMETFALLTGAVIGLARAELAATATATATAATAAAATAATATAGPAPGAQLADLLGSGRFPHVAAALAPALAAGRPPSQPDPAAQFDRLLDRFLDGLVPGAVSPPGGGGPAAAAR